MNNKEYEARIKYEVARSEFEQMEKEYVIAQITLPKHPSKDGYYRVMVKDPYAKRGRRQIAAKSIEALKEKVYLFEKKGKGGRCKKTFQTVFDICMEDKLRYVKSEAKRYSVENTVVRTKHNYKRYIKGTFIENKYVGEIGKRDLEQIILYNLERYEMKKKALDSLRSILKGVFDMAYHEEWIDYNPYERLSFNMFSNMLVEDTPLKKRFHSDEEIEKMLDYVRQKQVKSPGIFTSYALEFQIITGFRRGEIPPLMWSDITDRVYVHREMITAKSVDSTKKRLFPIVEHTKTHEDREFPVTHELEDLLNRIKRAQIDCNMESEYLFPSKNSYGVITNDTVYSFYKRMCNKLDVKISADVVKGPHAFRRTRITQFVNHSEGNLIMASKLFGNSPVVAERNYYTGVDMDKAKRILESNIS